MPISQKRLIAYSYLASINETNSSSDLIDIFSEFIKPVFFTLYNNNIKSGVIKDIKQEFDGLYDLNTPYPVLQSIVNKLGNTFQNVENPLIVFNTDYSFQMRDNPFPNCLKETDTFDKSISALNEAFEQYYEEHSDKKLPKLNIFEYIEANKTEFCEYFSNAKPFSAGTDTPQAILCCDFINSISIKNPLYVVLERLYTGSIISTYLELPASSMKPSKTTFIVDTNFVLSFLNLQSEASYHTTSLLVDTCKKLGHQFAILDITIQEVYNLIYRFSSTYKAGILPALCDPESIDAASFRNNLTKSGLVRIASTFRRRLENNKIAKITLSEGFKEEARGTDIYKAIQNRQYNPDGAPHDGYATYYVMKMRNFKPRTFADATYWFLTDSKYLNNSCIKPDGTMFERIRADYLMSILWFSAPSLRATDKTKLGLSKLMHHTMKSAAPDMSLLRQFEENIRRYAHDEITDDDIILLSSTTACRSVDKLRSLNEVAKESPSVFRQDLFNLVKENRAAFEEKLSKSKQLVETLSAQKQNLEEGNRKIYEESKNQIRNEISRLATIVEDLKQIEHAISVKAKNNTNRLKGIVLIVFILFQIFTVVLSIKLDWNTVERFIWWSTLLPLLFTELYLFIKGKSFNPIEFFKNENERQLVKIAKSMNFDLGRISGLTKEITTLSNALDKM